MVRPNPLLPEPASADLHLGHHGILRHCGTSTEVVDEMGDSVAPGTTGELVVSGPHVMRGYWRNEAATARALRTDAATGRMRLHTGDLFTCAGCCRFWKKRQGARVLLLDADIRNPGATRALARHATEGLLEVLLEGRNIRDVLLHDEKTRLAFLPTVVKQRVPHSSELSSGS